MPRTGTSHLPLHGGKAPRWLFQRMVRLAGCITETMVSEYGADAMLHRISDPFWFQALGCVLGFDWHSSGVTTTTCGALKEGTKNIQDELGLYVCGGKGATSRKTPDEILQRGDRIKADAEDLVYASRLSAKVDSSAVQDGYQIYQHSFFFTKEGKWAVVQQGMNDESGFARRYHWLGEGVEDFVCEPHSAVCSSGRGQLTLNLVAEESESVRGRSPELMHEHPEKLIKELKKIVSLDLPKRHQILAADINPDRIGRILLKTYDENPPPENFEMLLGTAGVGAKTLRALTLLSELIYGDSASFRDPARFSFAHGGKDGIPYPVDRKEYDNTIKVMKKAIHYSKMGRQESFDALKRLSRFEREE